MSSQAINKMKAITKISDPKVVAKSREGGVAAKAMEGTANSPTPKVPRSSPVIPREEPASL
ncbi:hypothetical protein VCR17J2_480016 [Vibrio coralliirubri]|nr:hypothetical protein VCR1J2_240089 [Vibrio coralliirubri]CDU13573.1 hypothetical protein VCR17J2_480016 [Vibrio coralliirubri]